MSSTEGVQLRAGLTRLMPSQGRCDRLPSREVTREEMLMCHTEEHVDLVEAASEMASAGLRLNQVGVCVRFLP
jgi:acetoin utilization deacetylase AcuC-like enzyme